MLRAGEAQNRHRHSTEDELHPVLLFTVDPFHTVQEARMAFFFPLQIGSPLCFLTEVVTKY